MSVHDSLASGQKLIKNVMSLHINVISVHIIHEINQRLHNARSCHNWSMHLQSIYVDAWARKRLTCDASHV